MPFDDILLEAEDHMDKAVEFLKQEFRTVRTGRASVGLVDSLKVEVESYGASLTLRELANLAVAEGNVVVIRPFDPSTLKDIERAIEKSGLGINPQNDGKLIRLSIPRLTEERRRDLVRVVARRTEEARVAVRNLRRDSLKDLQEFEKEKMISEDDFYRGKDEIQDLTDEFIQSIDEIGTRKEEEVMEI